MPQPRPFRQVDVFSSVPFMGNPLAVVLGADGLDEAQLLAGADYTVRQGTCLQRDGRVSVTFRAGQAWIGGACVTVIEGTILA